MLEKVRNAFFLSLLNGKADANCFRRPCFDLQHELANTGEHVLTKAALRKRDQRCVMGFVSSSFPFRFNMRGEGTRARTQDFIKSKFEDLFELGIVRLIDYSADDSDGGEKVAILDACDGSPFT